MVVLMDIAAKSTIVVAGLFLIAIGIGIIINEIRRWVMITRLRNMVKKIEKEGLENIKAEVREL